MNRFETEVIIIIVFGFVVVNVFATNLIHRVTCTIVTTPRILCVSLDCAGFDVFDPIEYAVPEQRAHKQGVL